MSFNGIQGFCLYCGNQFAKPTQLSAKNIVVIRKPSSFIKSVENAICSKRFWNMKAYWFKSISPTKSTTTVLVS